MRAKGKGETGDHVLTREDVLAELSHLPANKLDSFSESELDVLARLMSACLSTGQPQIDMTLVPEDEIYSCNLTLVAPDWAGLLDAVSGAIHERGHNIQYLTAMVNASGHLAIIILFLRLTKKEAKALEMSKNELVSLLAVSARGGMSIRRMVTIGTSKIRVYSATLEELGHMATPDEMSEMTVPGGELEMFITTRSESYLTERFPRDLAILILVQHRFQKKVLADESVQVKVSNLKTTRENLTGISVAGIDQYLSLDVLLDAIREFVPDYKRKYDKEFVTSEGVVVVRLEIVDADYQPLSPEACVSLQNFLLSRLQESRIKRRDLRMKSGAELIGRILIPRLIEETETTDRPQLLILPEGMEEGIVQFRIVLVNRDEDHSERIRQSMDGVGGLVVASLKTNKARDDFVSIFTLFVDTSHFNSEEEIYAAIKKCVSAEMPDIRDFDEGMRQMGIKKLKEIQALTAERSISFRFVKRVFYGMDDAYRVTTSAGEMAEEIVFVNDLLTRFLSKGGIVADYISHENHLVFGIAGPNGGLSVEPYVEMFREHQPIFIGLEMMGVNIYLFRIRKTRAVKPTNLLKEVKSKEALR